MTFKQLEYFMEIARTLSFSRAAKNLYISQSALSRSILALEQELGVILFLRDRHTVALTTAGAIFASNLPRLAEDLNRTIELVQQVKEGMRGRLALGVVDGFAFPEVIAGAIKYCQSSMPFVTIDVTNMNSNQLTNALGNGRIDFMLTWYAAEEEHPSHTTNIKIEQLPICLAASVQSSSLDSLTFPILKNQHFIFQGNPKDPSVLRWIDYCRSNGFMPSIAFCQDNTTCISLIELGFGVGIFPANHRIFTSPLIKRIDIPQPYKMSSELIWNTENLNPIVDVFARMIKSDL